MLDDYRRWLKGHPRYAMAAVCAFLLIGLGVAVSLYASHMSAKRLPFPISANPVVAFRIDPMRGQREESQDFHGWHLITTGADVPSDLATSLRSILLSPATYTLQSGSCFEPGLAFSFGNGAQRVDAIICLECGKAVFYFANQTWERRLSDDGTAQLLDVYHRLFGVNN